MHIYTYVRMHVCSYVHAGGRGTVGLKEFCSFVKGYIHGDDGIPASQASQAPDSSTSSKSNASDDGKPLPVGSDRKRKEDKSAYPVHPGVKTMTTRQLGGCVPIYVRACMHACVRLCVRLCRHACKFACLLMHVYIYNHAIEKLMCECCDAGRVYMGPGRLEARQGQLEIHICTHEHAHTYRSFIPRSLQDPTRACTGTGTGTRTRTRTATHTNTHSNGWYYQRQGIQRQPQQQHGCEPHAGVARRCV